MDQYGVSILKKILLILSLLLSLCNASDLRTEQKIYDRIIHALLAQKQTIKVWSDTEENRKLLTTIPGIDLVDSPKKADFLLLSKELKDPKNAIIFVTNFPLLQKMQKSAVGGFFWQKGRPNILFLEKNLNKHHIVLPQSMQEFVEEEL